MTWLVWRLHRTQLYIAARACWPRSPCLLLVTGLQMASQYHSALAACAASHSCAQPAPARCSWAAMRSVSWSS